MEIVKDVENCPEVSFGLYIAHAKLLLKLFRMWKFGDADFSKFQRILVTLNATVLLSCNLLLGLSELTKIQSAEDLRMVASGIGAFWLHFLGFFKWLYFVWKVFAVVELLEKLEDCYSLSLRMIDSIDDASRLREEMSTAKKSSLRFTYVWIILVMYGVVHWCMNPIFLRWSQAGSMNMSLFEKERPLPYESWIPWDTTEPFGYWLAFMLEFLGGFAACIGHICYDVFHMTMVMMICAQFRYLNYVLDYDKTPSKTRKKLTGYLLKKKLTRGKIYHNAILEFLASFEKVTSPVMFVQCIGTMGILCLVSFEAMTMKLQGDMKNTIRVWSMMEYIISCFTQLYAFCYYASQVTALGLRVGDSAYSCGWESLESENGSYRGNDQLASKRDMKSVEFLTHEMITRAQRPVQLTGGPFYVLSLETYCAVVKAAFSFSAVLRELGEE